MVATFSSGDGQRLRSATEHGKTNLANKIKYIQPINTLPAFWDIDQWRNRTCMNPNRPEPAN